MATNATWTSSLASNVHVEMVDGSLDKTVYVATSATTTVADTVRTDTANQSRCPHCGRFCPNLLHFTGDGCMWQGCLDCYVRIANELPRLYGILERADALLGSLRERVNDPGLRTMIDGLLAEMEEWCWSRLLEGKL